MRIKILKPGVLAKPKPLVMDKSIPDAFVRSFVGKTCRDIIDDVEKLDTIQDGKSIYPLPVAYRLLFIMNQ